MADCVLVTGGTGFVGTRLVRALVDRGEHVKVLARPGSSLRVLDGLPPSRVEVAIGDILIEHTLYRALTDCDRMYHVASNFRMWSPHPEEILRPAIEGTRNALSAARKRGLRKVVVTSSVAALGTTTPEEPMDEEHDLNLDDPETYILSKYRALLEAEEWLDRGVPLVSVLPTGIFGPGDWKPTPSGAGLLEYMKFPPWAPFPVTRGGLNAVDVDDVVRGHLLAMDTGRVGERYILGGENLTFEDMFGLAHAITGLAVPGKPAPEGLVRLGGRLLELGARLGGDDPAVTYRLARDYAFGYAWVTSAKAEKELGYAHRPAREAFERAIGWYLENGYVPERVVRRLRLELRPVG